MITAPFPPAIVELPSGRYVVGGSSWLRVESDFTMEQAHTLWQRPKHVEPPKPRVFEVANSKGNGFYQVTVGGLSGPTCTCPGFGFRRTCKHVDTALKLIS